MKFRKSVTAVTLLLWFVLSTSAVEKKLANDAYQPDDQANYQAGFVSGEIMGSTYSVELNEYPFELLSIEVLVGDGTQGGITQGTFIVHVWEDTGGEEPGIELISPFAVDLTAGYLNIIDLEGLGIPEITQNAVRVGLEFTQNPPPSFLSDTDGFIVQHVNTLYSINFGWHYSEFFGLTGDWIMRLNVDTAIEPPTATPTGPPGTQTPYPTHTPQSTYTPYPTYTPAPTYTVLPTTTPKPTTTAGPTSTPTSDTSRIELWMPTRDVSAGMPFLLNAIITNSGKEWPDSRLLGLLIVGNATWYYPDWSQSFNDLSIDLLSGETVVPLIPEFIWPTGTGSMSHLIFVAGLVDSEYNLLPIDPDLIIWSFSD